MWCGRWREDGVSGGRIDSWGCVGGGGVQYYLKTGTCKFGATCKYHHPREKAGSTGRVLLNVLGLPLRLVGGVGWFGSEWLCGLLWAEGVETGVVA